MPKITAVFYNNDKKSILQGNFKEKLMNLLVISPGVLQAYNTRQVQHLLRLVKYSFRESMLKSTLYLFGRKKTEGGHTKQNGTLNISMSFSSVCIGKRNRVSQDKQTKQAKYRN